MNLPITPPLWPFASVLRRFAIYLKMGCVVLLILCLLIPLGMIRSILSERLGRRNAAIEEMTTTWGREQNVVGPVLIVPYRYASKSWKERPAADGKIEKMEVTETAVARAYFLPANLAITGDIQPTQLRRGIYQAVVYAGTLELAGQFARPSFAAWKVEDHDILWDDAVVAFAIPDLRGVKGALQLHWGESRLPLLPGSNLRGFTSGVFTRVGRWPDSETLPFKLSLTLNGSGGIHFAPVGEQNSAKLTSPWPDPSFCGAFLPAERQVTPAGFAANWKLTYYGRDYAQQWIDAEESTSLNATSAANSLFGVRFLAGVDAYRHVERAIKYGILFLVLVFTAFFLFEIVSAVRIHPFQYALVGAALCLFYLGLLSLSEFIAFSKSYVLAATMTTLLIWFYCVSVLRSGRRTLIVVGLLAAIYSFLFVALQLQDYALLFGTGGLFLALTAVFLVTRNIDWYTRDQSPTTA